MDVLDRRQALSLNFISTIPATNDSLETAGGDLTATKTASLYDKWPEILGLGENGFCLSLMEMKDLIVLYLKL